MSSGRPDTLNCGRMISRLRRCRTSSRQNGISPGTHLLHRRLILAAPGVGECDPVERMAERLEDCLGFAGDAGAPVDQRAEHVEKQSLGKCCHAAMIANCRGPAKAAAGLSTILQPLRGCYSSPTIHRAYRGHHVISQHHRRNRLVPGTQRRQGRSVLRAPGQARPRRRRGVDPPRTGMGRMDHRDDAQDSAPRLRLHLAASLFPRRAGRPGRRRRAGARRGRRAGQSGGGRRLRRDRVPEVASQLQRQDRSDRLLFRRPPCLLGFVHARRRDQRRGRLLGRQRDRGRPQAAQRPSVPSRRSSSPAR